MPTAYTLVKRGKGFSTVDKGYRALVRDYPERWRNVVGQCLALMREEWRSENELRLREQPISVGEKGFVMMFNVNDLTFLRLRKRGASATYTALVPVGNSGSFSHVFTFSISKGKIKETAEVKSFLRRFPENGWAMIEWMERSVINGEE